MKKNTNTFKKIKQSILLLIIVCFGFCPNAVIGQELDCANAISINVGNTYAGNTANGSSNFANYNYDSIWKLTGKEIVYELDWPGGALDIELTNKTANLGLMLLNSCDGDSGFLEQGENRDNTQNSIISKYLGAGTYYIVVDGYEGAEGTYDLQVKKYELDCTTAISINAGITEQGNTANGTNNFAFYNNDSYWKLTGKEIVYELDWSGGVLDIELTNKTANLGLMLLNSCDGDSGFQEQGENRDNTQNSTITKNADAGTYYIVVDGYEGAEGTYDLQVKKYELDCTTAISINAGITVQGNTANGTNNFAFYGNDSWWKLTGKEIIYELDWPGGALEIELTNKSANLGLMLLNSCDGDLGYIPNGGAGGNRDNTQNSTITKNVGEGTYYIVVDGYEGAEGTYSLSLKQSESIEIGTGEKTFTFENNILYEIDEASNKTQVETNVASFGKSWAYMESSSSGKAEEVLWIKKLGEDKARRYAGGNFNNEYLKQVLSCSQGDFDLYADVVFDSSDNNILENTDVLRCENGNTVAHQKDGIIKILLSNNTWLDIKQIITVNSQSYYIKKDDSSIWQVSSGSASKIGENGFLLQDNDNQLINVSSSGAYYRYNNIWESVTPKYVGVSPEIIDEGFWFFIQSKKLLDTGGNENVDHKMGLTYNASGELVMSLIPNMGNCEEFLWKVNNLANGKKILINKAKGANQPLLMEADGSLTFEGTTGNRELEITISNKKNFGTVAYNIKGLEGTKSVFYDEFVSTTSPIASDINQTWVFQFNQMVKDYFLPLASQTNLQAHYENSDVNISQDGSKIAKDYNKFLKGDNGVTFFGTNTSSDWVVVNYYFVINNLLNAIVNPLPSIGGHSSKPLSALKGQSLVLINKNDLNSLVSKQYFTADFSTFSATRYRGSSSSNNPKKWNLVSEELTNKRGIVQVPTDNTTRRFDHGVHEFTHAIQHILDWVPLVDAEGMCPDEVGENSECFCVAVQYWFDSAKGINLYPDTRTSDSNWDSFMAKLFNVNNTWMPQKILRNDGYSPSGPTVEPDAPIVTLTSITQDNIQTAVDAWLLDPVAAEATYGHIKDWDVSEVTIMSSLFLNKTSFNDDISGWDTSNVVSIRAMFNNASSFNQDIGGWDVSKVTGFDQAFSGATSFNQDISSWDVATSKNFKQMFKDAINFNKPLNNWDVTDTVNMQEMFRGATSFNQPLNSWNVSNITTMLFMFEGATNFNQDLTNWCATKIESEPIGFADNSALLNTNKPSWGTCTANTYVDTKAATSITVNSVVLEGNITSNVTVTEKGIVYALTSINSNPEINGTGVVKEDNYEGTGTFSETITGLTSNTEYSYKAYAITASGIIYGNVLTFTTLGNTPPVFTSVSSVNFTENTDGIVYTAEATDSDSITYSLGVNADESLFTIVGSTGEVSFVTSPDFETKASYTINVIATDALGNAANKDVIITIIDLDEVPPTFTSATAVDFTENESGVAYTITATDNGVITYNLGSGNDEASFTIDGAEVSFVTSPDFETKASYTINVIATDALGNAANKDVIITIIDLDEVPPTFTSATAVDFTENEAGVAYTITATDNGVITYNLGSGNDEASFTIDGAEVSFVASPDFETKVSYTINVIATDDLGNAANQDVIITIIDLDEVPPTVVITSSLMGPTSTTPIPVTVTFSETITGFDAGDISVSGGTIQSFTGTDADYSFDLVPSGGGTLTVDIAADVAQDAAGNNNTVANQFSIEYSDLPATALNFDGVDDYVIIGNVLPSNTSYTKEAWIFTEQNKEAQNIISSLKAPFWLNNLKLEATNLFRYSGSVQSPNTLPLNTWVHVAVSWDGTTMRLYENGVEVDSRTNVGNYTREAINLGAMVVGNPINMLDGNLDEVRIWNTARSSAEIVAYKDVELTGNESGLVAYYNFNQGNVNANNSGVTTLLDRQTNGTVYNGTLTDFTLTGSTSNWIDGLANDVVSGSLILSTLAATDITTVNATLSGLVITVGSKSISEKGIMISDVNTNPTIPGAATVKYIDTSAGNDISITRTDLNIATQYYFRTYAIDADSKTFYGDVFTFNTSGHTAPEISTSTATDITLNSATLSGTITVNGTKSIIETGFVIAISSENADPTISGTDTTKLESGSISDEFISFATGLSSNVQYSFKAYLIDEDNTEYYGAVKTFTTPNIGLPTVTTTPVYDVEKNFATFGGNVVTNNGSSITAMGILFSPTASNSNPQLNGTDVQHRSKTPVGVGEFTLRAGSFSSGVQYSYRMYATNAAGTAYSQVFTFYPQSSDVSTEDAINFTTTSAMLSGIVNDNYGSSITEKGVVYSIASINNKPLINGTGVTKEPISDEVGGYFVETINGLDVSTEYSFRTYAINAFGTSYGAVKTFTTESTFLDKRIGYWTFEGGSVSDSEGNFGDLVFENADVSIVNGKLDVKSNGWARTSSYVGSTIEEKTLVSFVELRDLSVTAGAVIAIDGINNDNFDAIVFAERQAKRWMAGSTSYHRTEDATPGFEETVTNIPVMMAITYVRTPAGIASVKIYRNGEEIGAYYKGVFLGWAANNTEILFGPRHTPNSSTRRGNVDVLIDEAMIFNRALSPTEIKSLYKGTIEKATIATTAAASIDVTTVTLGGNITSDGRADVTERGVVYSRTNANESPEIDGNGVTKVESSNGIGVFTENITGLSGGTEYAFRAYAVNNQGTAYGDVLTFTTSLPSAPTVTTIDVTSVEALKATFGSTVTNNGGADIEDVGVILIETSLNNNPEVTTTDVVKIGVEDMESFTGDIENLKPNTAYSYRAYADNNTDFGYGISKTFTTGVSLGVITTTIAYEITENEAVSGIGVNSNGGSLFTEYGVVLSDVTSNTDPLLGGGNVIKIEIDGATGSPTSGLHRIVLTGLSSCVKYAYKAFATNSAGTTYGPLKTFTTQCPPPPGVASITSVTPQAISENSAILAGDISSDNGAAVIKRGIVYAKTSENTLPTIGGADLFDVEIGSGIGAYNYLAKGLTPNTSYSYRAYAINSVGTVYGDLKEFSTTTIPSDFPSGLIGHWDFENGSVTDKTGNWSDLILNRNTSIVEGKLDLNPGSLANTTSYSGKTIKEKTLVSFVELQSFSARAGSILTIDGQNRTDNFDGIVFSERELNKWMAGSSWFRRTENPSPGFEEITIGEPIMMAITYTETADGKVKIRIYRNAIEIGSYTKGNITTWSSGNVEVLFGARHTLPSMRGNIDALVNEAMIFNRPLSDAEIMTLYRNSINTAAVVTIPVHSIGTETAVFGGNVLNDGGDNITDRGIVIAEKATNANPEIGGSGAIKSQIGEGKGFFGAKISGLAESTEYAYKSYATNSSGTVYGNLEEFSTITIDSNIEPDFSTANQRPTQVGGQYFVAPTDGVLLSISLRSFYATSGSYLNRVNILVHESNLSESDIELGKIQGIVTQAGHIDANQRSKIDMSSAGINLKKGKRYYYSFEVEILAGANKGVQPFGLFSYVAPISNYPSGGYIINNNNGGVTTATESTEETSVFSIEIGPSKESIDGITTFTAGSSNDFSNPANWSKGIPGKNESIAVANGVTLTVDQNDVELDDFFLNSGAELDIPDDKEVVVNSEFSTDGSLSLGSSSENSGVLFVKGSTAGTITYKRGGLLENKWSIISAPVSGQKVVEFAQNENNDIRINTNVSPNRYAIGYYDDTQVSNKWQYFNASTAVAETFEIGRSYSMSRTTDGQVTFVGTLEVNDVSSNASAGGWVSIGNPYTTYMPANKNSDSSFLLENYNLLDDNFKGIYIWDNDQNKYVAVSELDVDPRSLPPGQGFFINVKPNSVIAFSQDQRQLKPSEGNTNFSKVVNPEIILNISDGSSNVKTHIKYYNQATRSFDVGYDIGNFSGTNLDIFTHLVENSNGYDYTIQSLPLNDVSGNISIPVGILAKTGQEITFSLEKTGIDEKLNIYLEDKVLNSLTSLSKEDEIYKFTVDEDINGIGRFYLTTSSKTLGNDDFEFTDNISIYTTNNSELKIVGLPLGDKAAIKLFNTLGKEVGVFNIKDSKIQNIIDLNNFSKGIYFVKLKSSKVSISKKVILK